MNKKYQKVKRTASHAGSWYSNQFSQLSSELKKYILRCKMPKEVPSGIFTKAIVSPHAGFVYSGSTAAYGYKLLKDTIARNSQVRRVFVLGFAHHFYLEGCAMSKAQSIETPLGHLQIDAKVRNDLERTNLFRTLTIEQDEEEHSLELQFPFIKLISSNRDIQIVNIMVGEMNSQYLKTMTKVLKPYFLDDESLFVFSTDFCHWGKRFGYQNDYRLNTQEQLWQGIERVDQRGVEFILQKNLKGFDSYIDETQNTICGRNPIRLLINMLADSDVKNRYKVAHLKYDQSEKVQTKYDSSVSYVSMAVYA